MRKAASFLLPLLLVPISIPAGYPATSPGYEEPLPTWFDVATSELLFVPLVLLGVAAGKLYARHARRTGSASLVT